MRGVDGKIKMVFREINDKLSLNCSGTEREEGWGEGGEGRGYLTAEREGVFVCDGQKGGRACKQIQTEQSGCYGGAGGPREECTCDNDGRLDWSVGCKRRAANAAASEQADILYFFLYLYCNNSINIVISWSKTVPRRREKTLVARQRQICRRYIINGVFVTPWPAHTHTHTHTH